MSEIKGQLLGIILVLAIFGAIGAAIYGAFNTAGSKVASKINVDTIEQGITAKQSSGANSQLLTFKD